VDFLMSFVDQYRNQLNRIILASFRRKAELVTVAYRLGRNLDEGIHPRITRQRIEVASELGYVVGPKPPVTAVHIFVRDVPNPEY